MKHPEPSVLICVIRGWRLDSVARRTIRHKLVSAVAANVNFGSTRQLDGFDAQG